MAGRKPAFLPAAIADEDGEERTMELTIEALTGTVYDLCVSPYETILGIKMKVQRLEGEKCQGYANSVNRLWLCSFLLMKLASGVRVFPGC